MLSGEYSYMFFLNVLSLYVYILASKKDGNALKVLAPTSCQHHSQEGGLRMYDVTYVDRFSNAVTHVPLLKLGYAEHLDQLKGSHVNSQITYHVLAAS